MQTLQTVQPIQKLSRLAVSDEGFAFDPSTGDSYLLNSSALSLLRWLQQGKQNGQLAEALSERYGIASDGASRDVGDFLTRLKSIRLM